MNISDEAVEAAAREESKVSRSDTVVNARTVRRYERAIEAVLEVCDEMDVGAQ